MQIGDRTLQREELIVVGLGNIDPQSIMNGDDEIGLGAGLLGHEIIPLGVYLAQRSLGMAQQF